MAIPVSNQNETKIDPEFTLHEVFQSKDPNVRHHYFSLFPLNDTGLMVIETESLAHFTFTDGYDTVGNLFCLGFTTYNKYSSTTRNHIERLAKLYNVAIIVSKDGGSCEFTVTVPKVFTHEKRDEKQEKIDKMFAIGSFVLFLSNVYGIVRIFEHADYAITHTTEKLTPVKELPVTKRPLPPNVSDIDDDYDKHIPSR